MFRFLKQLDLWHQRRENLRRRFAERFGVPFPFEEGQRMAIRDRILKVLVDIGGEAEAARVELEEKQATFSNPDLDRGTEKLVLMWAVMAANVVDKKGKEYRELKKLARRAGFSANDLHEADRLSAEAGAKGGLIFSAR